MILLDTCALLWLAEGSPRISTQVLDRIDAEATVSVSAVSALEIGLKTRAAKLRLPMPAAEWWRAVCEHHSLDVLLVEPAIYLRSAELPPIHKDPVDRIIVATAEQMRAPVVTADSHFAAYGVEVIL